MMPTMMRIGPYRFFFFSNEGNESRHIHVRSGNGEAKFWLSPVKMAWSTKYNERESKQIEYHIRENLLRLLNAWDEYFGV